MKIVLIGNYPLDKQESMERFLQMLNGGFLDAGINTVIWKPVAFFALKNKITTAGFNKWLGYLDKWILFPIIIKWRLIFQRSKYKDCRFHLCDHSNAIYLKYLPQEKTVITCHDVLAIRGAMGYADAYCPASGMGKILQKWILNSLIKARYIACVSHFTLNQLIQLTANQPTKEVSWQVIHNAMNARFDTGNPNHSKTLLKLTDLPEGVPYLLHVGSNLPRKNRKMLVDMLAAIKESWEGIICFAGQAPNGTLLKYIDEMGLKSRVITVSRPSHDTLVALYNNCAAFVFPSFSEGFGWPIIEAQACEVPVITSNFEPFIEVSGGEALFADPTKPAEFANAFLSLNDTERKLTLIKKGKLNSEKFSKEQMISAYLKIHQLAIK